MNTLPDRQRRVLGKGLSALLPQKPAGGVPPQLAPETGPRVASIPIADIHPNPLQPRTVFDAAHLNELSNSIETHGIIQPLLVRRKGASYELIAGERRLRAAKLAGLVEVPAIVQDYADDRILEIALIENIQREDLNPMETAQALERLHTEMNLSHEEIAARTGKDRTTITNLIRLLRLPQAVQLLVAERRLSMGHARAILGLTNPELQLQLAEKAAAVQTEPVARSPARMRRGRMDERRLPAAITGTEVRCRARTEAAFSPASRSHWREMVGLTSKTA